LRGNPIEVFCNEQVDSNQSATERKS
jgi:hypothetical protein